MKESKQERPVRSIEFYKGGVKLWGDKRIGNPTGKGRQNRGVIFNWSIGSRRRMREFLLTHTGQENLIPCGITLTIPGPVPTVKESKAVWEKFRLWFKNENHSAVWRIESQKRGAMHWHLLAFLNIEKVAGDYLQRVGCSNEELPEAYRLWSINEYIRNGWFNALDILGACSGEVKVKGKKGKKDEIGILEVKHRRDWFGADQFAVKVSLDDGRGAWLRYLQDHSTKAKQEQIPENIGRHWGIINRKGLVQNLPEKIFNMSPRKWYAFLRSYQRLCTSSCKAPEAPFGRRLRRRLKRGAVGGSVWFSRPETVSCLASFFLQSYSPVQSQKQ